MQPRDWKQRLQDIIEAAERIDRYTSGRTFEVFRADQLTIDAVIRNMEVIGEAAGHIPAEVQSRYPHVPWSEMRRMRNLLAHQYFGVNLSVLWQTITHDLPPLRPMLEAILAQEP